MNKRGPVIVIEDDADDRELLAEVFGLLAYPNQIVFFTDGDSALEYLKDEKVFPFLILSDVNMPKVDGFQLRKIVQTDTGLSEKCIPYLFFSTHVSREAVHKAYCMSVQGFFMKPNNFEQIKNTIRKIMEYWQECYSPGNY